MAVMDTSHSSAVGQHRSNACALNDTDNAQDPISLPNVEVITSQGQYSAISLASSPTTALTENGPQEAPHAP